MDCDSANFIVTNTAGLRRLVLKVKGGKYGVVFWTWQVYLQGLVRCGLHLYLRSFSLKCRARSQGLLGTASSYTIALKIERRVSESDHHENWRRLSTTGRVLERAGQICRMASSPPARSYPCSVTQQRRQFRQYTEYITLGTRYMYFYSRYMKRSPRRLPLRYAACHWGPLCYIPTACNALVPIQPST